MSHYQYLQIRIGAAAPTEEEAAALFAPERVRSCIQTIENLRNCLFRKWAGSANLVQQTFSLGCMFAQPIVDTFMAWAKSGPYQPSIINLLVSSVE